MGCHPKGPNSHHPDSYLWLVHETHPHKLADVDYEPPNEAEPTSATPGSKEKVSVMARRVELGQPLNIPGDTSADEPEPQPVETLVTALGVIENAIEPET